VPDSLKAWNAGFPHISAGPVSVLFRSVIARNVWLQCSIDDRNPLGSDAGGSGCNVKRFRLLHIS
jgi:hypothetical protein